MNEQERKDFFKKTFNTVSDGYDSAALRFFPESAKQLSSFMNLQGNEHILDVATGTGNVALTLAESLPDGQVTGIDFSEGMLCRAREKKAARTIRNVNFTEMDMQAIEFPDNRFDAATCAFSIFFLEDMQSQVSHMAEKVKHGGSVVTTTFQEKTFFPLIEIFLITLAHYDVEIPPMTWKRVATKEKCTSLFKDAALKDVRC
jgi:ubiquinone/menaquinone biosynthesis C-methylase UbiE